MSQEKIQILKNYLISDIKKILPNGKQEGDNWVTINPKREDKSLGSFKVNTKNGLWADFATNEKGDVIELFKYITGLSFSELLKKYNIKTEPILNKEPNLYSKKHSKYPDKIYKYYSEDGKKVLLYVCRYNLDNGEKDFIVCHFDEKLNSYVWKTLPEPRPLYNLHLSYRKNVLIVEGEKTCDFVQEILGDDWFVCTWQGGSNSVKKSNFKFLNKFEKIYIWPDNDSAGFAAAQEIKNILGQKAHIVNLPLGLPPAWDLADADKNEWTKERIIKQLNEEKKELPSLQKAPFRVLGMQEGKCYFLSKNKIFAFSPTDIKKANLIYIADKNYWEENYRGPKGADWDSIANHLAQLSRSVNFYSDDLLRGRGAFIDNGRYVYHAGDKIICDKQVWELEKFKTDYVYESLTPIHFDLSNELSANDSNKLLKLISSFSWKNKASSILLLGWLVCAPICGALEWRSSIWITGESGSGKSWIICNVLKKLIEKFSLCVQGSTTESGIRQALKMDSFPIIFDEFENINKQSSERIEKILEIARTSSSGNDSKILKGSPGGKGQSYNFKTMFAFSSINVSAKQTADINRITILELLKSEQKEFAGNLIVEFINDKFIDRFFTKIIFNIHRIIKNINIFRRVSGNEYKDQRKGDQLGTLFGGAYSFLNEGCVTEEAALNFIQSYDISENHLDDKQNDSEKCFQHLMAYTIKIGHDNIPIGSLIAHVLGKKEFPNLLEGDPPFYLKSHGILVENNKVIIANRHPKLDTIFNNTQFDIGYGIILRRLKGAQPVGEKRFGSQIRISAWSYPFFED